MLIFGQKLRKFWFILFFFICFILSFYIYLNPYNPKGLYVCWSSLCCCLSALGQQVSISLGTHPCTHEPYHIVMNIVGGNLCLAEGKFGVKAAWCFCSTSFFRSCHCLPLLGPFFGKTASFKFWFLFFLIICFICLLSFHSSFSETAILRNILFMCIGGWVYSSDKRTIRAKNKWKGQSVLLMHFILFWKCSKTGSTVPGSVGWCCFILFTFATFLCSFLSVLGRCFPPFVTIFLFYFLLALNHADVLGSLQ